MSVLSYHLQNGLLYKICQPLDLKLTGLIFCSNVNVYLWTRLPSI